MKPIGSIAVILILVGAIFIGLWQIDGVARLFSGQTGFLNPVVYVLIAVAVVIS